MQLGKFRQFFFFFADGDGDGQNLTVFIQTRPKLLDLTKMYRFSLFEKKKKKTLKLGHFNKFNDCSFPTS